MNIDTFSKLQKEGLISDEEMQRVTHTETTRLFSLHWEIKTALYLGVLLLSGGLGTLVYKNIDTIGHQVILLFIALLCIGCYAYCFRHRAPFSREKTESPNAFYDYALLLGSLTFVTFIGYLQYQYAAFGTAYGLAIFIPMVALFATAYYFDHLGILSMAITNLAAWAGIAITPFQVLSQNDFSNHTLIYTGTVLGIGLVAMAELSEKRDFKKHFAFTYRNFGVHIFFIATIAGMCIFDNWYFVWFLLAAGGVYLTWFRAFRDHSFYFVMLAVLYGYVALTILLTRVLFNHLANDFFLAFMYMIVSTISVIFLLVNLSKKIKQP
ncbi:DUF2157 domain-containing protein [Chitinophaga sp. G-6-1-13]|uniref:DUF2157 domain-containing protein n=1 Tax=Chitinophaga fulva TaxID=2728842 RepID=A0A848GX44_9BACT|nr:DUF2157 domain-containing protein [Chitinophaga fulva]NML41812.1 DUF2157 domain-containing protein [Chitinophaga fulva]